MRKVSLLCLIMTLLLGFSSCVSTSGGFEPYVEPNPEKGFTSFMGAQFGCSKAEFDSAMKANGFHNDRTPWEDRPDTWVGGTFAGRKCEYALLGGRSYSIQPEYLDGKLVSVTLVVVISSTNPKNTITEAAQWLENVAVAYTTKYNLTEVAPNTFRGENGNIMLYTSSTKSGFKGAIMLQDQSVKSEFNDKVNKEIQESASVDVNGI